MYKTFLKHQTTFFSTPDDVLAFFPSFTVTKNRHGLNVLCIDGVFQSSFMDVDKDDAILYYGNKYVENNIKGK
jgi:hypothetical protein